MIVENTENESAGNVQNTDNTQNIENDQNIENVNSEVQRSNANPLRVNENQTEETNADLLSALNTVAENELYREVVDRVLHEMSQMGIVGLPYDGDLSILEDINPN